MRVQVCERLRLYVSEEKKVSTYQPIRISEAKGNRGPPFSLGSFYMYCRAVQLAGRFR